MRVARAACRSMSNKSGLKKLEKKELLEEIRVARVAGRNQSYKSMLKN